MRVGAIVGGTRVGVRVAVGGRGVGVDVGVRGVVEVRVGLGGTRVGVLVGVGVGVPVAVGGRGVDVGTCVGVSVGVRVLEGVGVGAGGADVGAGGGVIVGTGGGGGVGIGDSFRVSAGCATVGTGPEGSRSEEGTPTAGVVAGTSSCRAVGIGVTAGTGGSPRATRARLGTEATRSGDSLALRSRSNALRSGSSTGASA